MKLGSKSMKRRTFLKGTATAAAVTYCHLRNLKDPEVEDLAEVFD